MKKLLLTTLLVIGLISPMAYASHESNIPHKHSKAGATKLKEAKIIIAHTEGMVCDFCIRGIEKVFGKKDEVLSVEVSLENQTVTLTLKDGKDISDEEVIKIIKYNGITTTKVHKL